MNRFLKYPEFIFLVAVSFATRFWNLAHIPNVVFDEAHFGLYATKYLSNQYYFDIHPPLGKMILGLFAWLANAKPGFDFAVRSLYGDFPFVALRLAPAIFGFLLVPLVYLLARALGFSRKIAFMAGFFILFDNALLVQSRFILLDMFLVFFVFLAVLLFVLFRKTSLYSFKWWFLGAGCGLISGFALSVKFIGLGVLGMFWLWMLFQQGFLRQQKKYIISHFVFFCFIPLFVYAAVLSAHLLLLPNSCNQNCGAVLSGNTGTFSSSNFHGVNIAPQGNFFKKFYEENKFLLFVNIGSSGGHHYYQSSWYSWPFMIRPLLYTTYPEQSKTAYVYLIGNPVVWLLSIIGVLGIPYIVARNFFYKKIQNTHKNFLSKSTQFLFFGYLMFFLSFAAVERFLMLYHYLIALVFSILIFVVFLDGMLSRLPKKTARIIYGCVLLLVFLSFLYFAPLTYGIPLTESQFHARMWLPTWSY